MDRIDAARLFLRIAERGSFSAAARDLKIKQSTASKWIAALEDEMGVTLATRTTRAIHLTEGGQRFQERAREVVAAFDAMIAETSDRSAAPMGRVRVSAPVVFGRKFVVPALARVLASHRKIEAEVVFADRYVNLVEEGFDLAVRVGVPSDTSARGRKLAESRRVLVASPSYVREHGHPTIPRHLGDHECIVHGAGDVWSFSRAGVKERPAAVRGRIAVNNSDGALAMARAGLGIALLADWLVRRDVARGKLVTLLDDHDAPPAPIYVLTPPGKYVSTPVRILVDQIGDDLAKALERPRRARGSRPASRSLHDP